MIHRGGQQSEKENDPSNFIEGFWSNPHRHGPCFWHTNMDGFQHDGLGAQRGHCNDVRALGINFDNRRVVLFSDAQFARGSFARVHQASVNRTDNTASNATVSRSDRSNSNGCYVVSACNHFSRLPVFHIRTRHRCLSVQKNSVLAVL
jgi:hypothetical protein